VQPRILDAFAQLGFVFKGADLEYGQIAGAAQTLPFFQEIEYFPAPQYAHDVNEVVLEFDKRGGVFSGGHDSYGRYTVRHTDADTVVSRCGRCTWRSGTVSGCRSETARRCGSCGWRRGARPLSGWRI
jgi:hypothetical protein